MPESIPHGNRETRSRKDFERIFDASQKEVKQGLTGIDNAIAIRWRRGRKNVMSTQLDARTRREFKYMIDSHFIPSSMSITVGQAQKARLQESGGIATGYHGTSASAAHSILEDGFRNSHPTRLDQNSAVYFTDGDDEKCLAGAQSYGINKALWNNEREYAVFRATFRDPEPDFMTGQSIWAVPARNIIMYSVEFYTVPEEFKPTFLMKLVHQWRALWEMIK
jgi:hypothetical protein